MIAIILVGIIGLSEAMGPHNRKDER